MSKTDKSQIEAKIALGNYDGKIENIEIQVQGVAIDLSNKENANILARNVMNAFEKTIIQLYKKDISKLN